MPALIILEIHQGMLFKPFEKFMAPIYELLIDNKFKEISMKPSQTATRSQRVDMDTMVFFNDAKHVSPQLVRDLGKLIKSTRSRSRFIKKITISYQLQDV